MQHVSLVTQRDPHGLRPLTQVPLQGCSGAMQLVPHWRKPSLQRMAQAPPLQSAVPFAVPGHAVHAAPQASTAVSALHVLPHRW